MRTLRVFAVAGSFVAALCAATAAANDGAASLATGGLELRSEPRISMETERLFIALDRVRVEYEFRNASTEDVTTEVAFVVPKFHPDTYPLGRNLYFGDFEVIVDGARVEPTREMRAWVGDRDVTSEILAAGLTVDLSREDCSPDRREGNPCPLDHLPNERLERLAAHGLVALDPAYPLWQVSLTPHWTQRFAAGKVIHVSHSYRPVAGGTSTLPATTEIPAQFPDGCFDAHALKAIEALRRRRAGPKASGTPAAWVDYVLTTANTWKTPIHDFELTVERPTADGIVSLCWDGPIERVGRGQFRARLKGFVPKRDLRIYFIP